MAGVRFDLLNDPSEVVQAHPGLGPFALMTETAGEITTIGDLDVDFFEFFQAARGSIWLKFDKNLFCLFFGFVSFIRSFKPEVWRVVDEGKRILYIREPP